ncbi:hypothetical protein SALBM217S_08698 [Streptomyces griseoloalbus]
MPTLDRHENVFVLDLGDGENRFHPDWITAVGAAFDEVEKAEGPRALVTAATGKFWSNGLDLEWLFAHADAYHDYVVSVHELFARLLSLPVVTVAALQGHTFAAGAMLSLAHDFRVMRADRGYWASGGGHRHPVHPGHVGPDPRPPDPADGAQGDDDGAAVRGRGRGGGVDRGPRGPGDGGPPHGPVPG